MNIIWKQRSNHILKSTKKAFKDIFVHMEKNINISRLRVWRSFQWPKVFLQAHFKHLFKNKHSEGTKNSSSLHQLQFLKTKT